MSSLHPADKAVSEAMQQLADELSERLEQIAGQKMMFSLCVFNSAPGSRINYVSNCDRSDVANCWKSMLHGWEQGMPDIPAHKVL